MLPIGVGDHHLLLGGGDSGRLGPWHPHFDPFGDGGDLFRSELLFRRHLQLTVVPNGIHQQAFGRLGVDHRRPRLPPLENQCPRRQSQVSLGQFFAVAFQALGHEHRPHMLFKELFRSGIGRENGHRTTQEDDQDRELLHESFRLGAQFHLRVS